MHWKFDVNYKIYVINYTEIRLNDKILFAFHLIVFMEKNMPHINNVVNITKDTACIF